MRPTLCAVCNNLCINSSESHRVTTCEACDVKVLRFDEIAVKTSKIDAVIEFVKTDFKHYDNRSHADGDLIGLLENLKKG